MQFEVYKDRKAEFRWRLRHSNGSVLAMSSESYKARTSALKCIETVKGSADYPVKELK